MRIVSSSETKLTHIKMARCYFGTKTGQPQMKYGVVTKFGTANSFITITFEIDIIFINYS